MTNFIYSIKKFFCNKQQVIEATIYTVKEHAPYGINCYFDSVYLIVYVSININYRI